MIILIEGTNYFQSLTEYKKQVQKFQSGGYSIEELKPDLENFDNQLDLTQNQGLFSSKILYVLKDFDKLNAERVEKLGVVAESIDLLIIHAKAFDKRKSFYKNIKKNGEVHSFNRLKGKELEKWILQKIKQTGLQLDGQTKVELVMRVGDDQQIIESEIDKLKKLHAEGEQITKEIVSELITDNSEVSVWDLTDNLISSNKRGSIKELDKVMQISEYEQVVGLIVSQLRLLYIASQVKTREAMIDHKIHPFVASKLVSKVAKFSTEKVTKLYEKIVNMEIAVKTGKIDKELALDLLVLAF